MLWRTLPNSKVAVITPQITSQTCLARSFSSHILDRSFLQYYESRRRLRSSLMSLWYGYSPPPNLKIIENNAVSQQTTRTTLIQTRAPFATTDQFF